ncbi:hypothetical protein EDD21DRAFT_360704, partial [Dissophora ornata]
MPWEFLVAILPASYLCICECVSEGEDRVKDEEDRRDRKRIVSSLLCVQKMGQSELIRKRRCRFALRLVPCGGD